MVRARRRRAEGDHHRVERHHRRLLPHQGAGLRAAALQGDGVREPDVRRDPEGRAGLPRRQGASLRRLRQAEPDGARGGAGAGPRRRDRRHPAADGQDLPRRGQPGGGGARRAAADALRLLRADLVDHLSQHTCARLPQDHGAGLARGADEGGGVHQPRLPAADHVRGRRRPRRLQPLRRGAGRPDAHRLWPAGVRRHESRGERRSCAHPTGRPLAHRPPERRRLLGGCRGLPRDEHHRPDGPGAGDGVDRLGAGRRGLRG